MMNLLLIPLLFAQIAPSVTVTVSPAQLPKLTCSGTISPKGNSTVPFTCTIPAQPLAAQTVTVSEPTTMTFIFTITAPVLPNGQPDFTKPISATVTRTK